MPTPTIPAGNLFMDATIWTGVNTANAITISNLQFQPDFVWGKSRSLAYGHGLYDSVRGTGKLLVSNNTNAEASNFLYGYISAFNSNGFTATPGSTDNENWNQTSATYVAWNWKAGGTAVTNTSGTISSQVSANTTSGFSVVTYTGTGSNATVGHGLGVAPQFIIVKNRTVAGPNWYCYNQYLDATSPQNYTIYLNLTNARDPATAFWNNTAPTSTVFTVGTSSGVNGSTNAMVAYCWTPIAGYSAFGSYTGNGSSDGPFIYTGFRPRWVMWKNSTQGSQWILLDTARNTYNVSNAYLEPNTSDTENTASTVCDILSNGFKLRNAGGTDFNENANTYIYAAFAENPFKYANAR